MFSTISWREFLSFLTVTLGGYYLVTGLIFYRHEIKSLFSPKKKKEIDNVLENQMPETETNLMGAPRYEIRSTASNENSVIAEDLVVLPVTEEQHSSTLPVSSDVKVVGTIADLIREINLLLEVIANHSKEDSVPLLQSLLMRYPQITESHYREAVSLFLYTQLKEQAEFDIPPREINSWWPNSNPNESH